MTTTYAGIPHQFDVAVGRVPVSVDWSIREMAIRNVGCNVLWFSANDGKTWADVAVGTSWDLRLDVRAVLFRTSVGTTRVLGVMTT